MEGAVAVPQNVEQLQIVIINTNTSRAITSGIVGINTIGNDLQFPLKELGQPSLQSYDIICQAYANDEWLAESSIPVDYLPMYQNSGAGNIVRISSESGTLMVTSQQGVLETIIPFGFVVDFRSNLQLSRIGQFVEYLQNLQVNTVQLIFSSQDYKNLTQLNLVLRTMSQAGIWVIYDVRNFYRDNALVKAHLETAKEYPNVLLYHTAMEPDGNQCSMDGLLLASQVIRQEDPYHPLATTLNCEDYYFSNYTDSTDIVVTNPYVIGVEPESRSSNFPSVTPQPTMYCNSTYGSCRCDNCKGTFLDLVHRLRLFRERRHILGKDRTMLFWGVPRSRGATDGSNRAPSGEQFLLTCTIYIIEGAVGLMTWNEKMDLSSDLAQGVQTFGSVLPTIANYLEKPQAFLPLPKTKPYPTDTFIANMWINRDTQKMLLLVANLASKAVSWKIDPPNCTMSSNSLPQTSYLYVSKGAQQAQAIYEGEKLKLKGQLNGYGFGAWIIACGLQDKKAKR